MRKISPTAPDTSKWRRWRRDCRAEAKVVAKAVANGEKPSFKQKLYRRKSIKEEWFFSGSAPFYGKCAYCETNIIAYQRGDVEHFRPKGAVADENDNPIVLRDEDGRIVRDENGQPKLHPGYYWLAYDWRNLLPACTICNQSSTIDDQKIGKHDRFPVDGQHAQTPKEQKSEKPLLIHPGSGDEKDDPDAHLSMDTETGLMKAKTDRGGTCIEVFGLNLREGLVSDRRRSSREVKELFTEFLHNRERRAEIVKELASIKAGGNCLAGNAATLRISLEASLPRSCGGSGVLGAQWRTIPQGVAQG